MRVRNDMIAKKQYDGRKQNGKNVNLFYISNTTCNINVVHLRNSKLLLYIFF